MDTISEKINKFFGVYPEDMRKRVTIAIFAGVAGAILVMLGLLYAYSSLRTTLIFTSGLAQQTAYTTKGIGMFLMFVYVLFLGSLLYFIFLPWKPEKRNF